MKWFLSSKGFERVLLVAIPTLVLAWVVGCVTSRQRAWEHYNFALESASYGEWEKCRQAFEHSIGSGVDLPGIHADYAVLLYKLGYSEAALEQLAMEEKIYPVSKPLVERIRAAIEAKNLKLPLPKATSEKPTTEKPEPPIKASRKEEASE